MWQVEVSSPDFEETYEFLAPSQREAGRYISFLVSGGMIPTAPLEVNFRSLEGE
jgi:hypothetical protein